MRPNWVWTIRTRAARMPQSAYHAYFNSSWRRISLLAAFESQDRGYIAGSNTFCDSFTDTKWAERQNRGGQARNIFQFVELEPSLHTAVYSVLSPRLNKIASRERQDRPTRCQWIYCLLPSKFKSQLIQQLWHRNREIFDSLTTLQYRGYYSVFMPSDQPRSQAWDHFGFGFLTLSTFRTPFRLCKSCIWSFLDVFGSIREWVFQQISDSIARLWKEQKAMKREAQ